MKETRLRPWQKLWLVLTLIWGIPWALVLRNPPGDINTYAWALAIVVAAPSLALYGLMWALASFFPSSK
jgi:hypothetical protein